MDRNDPIAEVGQRLGFFAYMTVMSGGRPFWPALFEGSQAVEALLAPAGESSVSSNGGAPFADTVPHEYQAERREHIAA